MRDIADAVGIGVSSLYNHYKSKDDLLAAFYSYFATQFTITVPTHDELKSRAYTQSALEALNALNYDYGPEIGPTLTKIIRVAAREARRDKKSNAFLEWYINGCLKDPIEFTLKALMKQNKIKCVDIKTISCIISNFAFAANFLSESSIQMSAREWANSIEYLFKTVTLNGSD